MSNKSFALIMGTLIAVFIMQLATIVVVGETSKRVERIEQVIVPQDTAVSADTLAPDFSYMEINEENFHKVCDYYGVQHADIVYAQAQLESGHFTSKVFRERQNCLGLFNSATQQYYTFAHWSDCIRAYKQVIQYRYEGGDYYTFLHNLPYAEDSQYIKKVRWLVQRNIAQNS